MHIKLNENYKMIYSLKPFYFYTADPITPKNFLRIRLNYRSVLLPGNYTNYKTAYIHGYVDTEFKNNFFVFKKISNGELLGLTINNNGLFDWIEDQDELLLKLL